MLAKLITLPMPSAMPSASSQPPLLRIEGGHQKRRKIAKNATTVIRAERQQPGEAHRARSPPDADDR